MSLREYFVHLNGLNDRTIDSIAQLVERQKDVAEGIN